MRVADEVLLELIEHRGNLKHWPLNAEGVLKLSLDLQEARKRIRELEQESAELEPLIDIIQTDFRSIKSRLTVAQTPQPIPDARAAFEANQPPPRRNPRHNGARVAKT